jgi:hypothetical protein
LDYLRAALGLALCAGPLLLLEVADGVALLLGALGVVFAWFGGRTIIRQLTRVELSRDAVMLLGPLSRRLAWRDLERMQLAYYAPRRARAQGWLQLTLRGAGGRPIRIDSTLPGFEQVLDHAVRAAGARALPLDGATVANLAALGHGDPAAGGPVATPPAPRPGGRAPLGSRRPL